MAQRARLWGLGVIMVPRALPLPGAQLCAWPGGLSPSIR